MQSETNTKVTVYLPPSISGQAELFNASNSSKPSYSLASSTPVSKGQGSPDKPFCDQIAAALEVSRLVTVEGSFIIQKINQQILVSQKSSKVSKVCFIIFECTK